MVESCHWPIVMASKGKEGPYEYCINKRDLELGGGHWNMHPHDLVRNQKMPLFLYMRLLKTNVDRVPFNSVIIYFLI